MIVPPLVALIAWVPISLVIFRRVPVRIALLINFVGGWAVLPAANYSDDGTVFPFRILGTSLESDYFLTNDIRLKSISEISSITLSEL